HLGDAYWRAGRKLEARFQWSHAKDLDPEPAELATIEDKLANGMKDAEPIDRVSTEKSGGNDG
ncbi:MAG: hypothetical protein KDJ77_18850, partial [Rhodobiaceae bacterium]|nr:hypothetical protein [Rhodobiaceae bacterium]